MRWPVLLTVLLGLLASSPTARVDPVLGDLNGDSWPDLLWQRDDGLLFAWLMTGATRTGGGFLTPGSVDPAWRAVGLADFDGNGSSDVLFRHTPSGSMFVWWMDHLVEADGAFLTPSVVLGNWEVVATEDFNGDNKSDIVWQEPSTGAIYIWYMNGATRTTATFATPAQVPAGWRIVGADDLNNDGHPDLVFRHTAGWVYVWFMNGATQIGGAYITDDPAAPAPLNPEWQIVAIADFDHDDNPDLIFQNVSTLTLSIVYLDGVLVRDAAILQNTLPLGNWRLVGGR